MAGHAEIFVLAVVGAFLEWLGYKQEGYRSDCMRVGNILDNQ